MGDGTTRPPATRAIKVLTGRQDPLPHLPKPRASGYAGTTPVTPSHAGPSVGVRRGSTGAGGRHPGRRRLAATGAGSPARTAVGGSHPEHRIHRLATGPPTVGRCPWRCAFLHAGLACRGRQAHRSSDMSRDDGSSGTVRPGRGRAHVSVAEMREADRGGCAWFGHADLEQDRRPQVRAA